MKGVLEPVRLVALVEEKNLHIEKPLTNTFSVFLFSNCLHIRLYHT